MQDFMLRTTTQDEMDDALIAAGLAQEVTDPDGEVMVQPVSGIAIDRIGPCGADTRYHANLRIADSVVYDEDELPTFAPLPATPYRVWFDG